MPDYRHVMRLAEIPQSALNPVLSAVKDRTCGGFFGSPSVP